MTLDEVVTASGLQPRTWKSGSRAWSARVTSNTKAGNTRCPTRWRIVVASEGTDHFVGGMWEMVAGRSCASRRRVVEAFAKGGGVPSPTSARLRERARTSSIAQYDERFASYWLKSLPDVVRAAAKRGRCSISAAARGGG